MKNLDEVKVSVYASVHATKNLPIPAPMLKSLPCAT